MLFEAFEVNEIALVIILYYIPICQFIADKANRYS